MNMRSQNVYPQFIHMKNDKKVQRLFKGATFGLTGRSHVKILCLLLALFVAGQGFAQTTVSRTSSVVAGVSTNHDSLWTYNLANFNIATRLSPTLSGGGTIISMNGLTQNPVTGDIYCIMRVSGQPNRVLGTIDIQTGICNMIGNLGDNFAALTCNSNGTLFGLTGDGGTVPSTMYRIDPATAATTFFRTLTLTGPGEYVIFCPANNFFYHWSGNAPGTVNWERFDTSGADVPQVFTPVTGQTEIFGGVYVGGGEFLVSNFNLELKVWDTSGVISGSYTTTPDSYRGLIGESFTSSISTTAPTTICAGSSVLLTVAGGTGGYQWYINGSAIGGETNATYSASAAGLYNCIYTDSLNISDSVATGINVTVLPLPTLTSAVTGMICNNDVFAYTQTGTGVASYHWGRAAVTHITTAASNGTGNISESLNNDTYVQVPVVYTDTLTGTNGCVNYYNITVTVNPTPVLFPTPLVGTICDGVTFIFTSNSQTPSADISYSWSRAATAGNAAASGTGGVITEVLNNPTTSPITVTYIDTLKAYTCTNLQTVQVIVNPTPVLSSTLTPHSICDSSLFHYLDSSLTTGIDSVRWTRGAVTGINNPAASGADSINEHLDNTSDNQITVTYVYSLYARGCSHSQFVNVVVNPTVKLFSTLNPPSICDSTLFRYLDTIYTVGASVAWSRAAITGIFEPASSGADSVHETLHNTTGAVIPVTYHYTMSIDGCPHSENVVVSVNPKPVLNNTAPAGICDSTLFSYTPAGTPTLDSAKWTRAFVPGIVVLPGSGSGNPNETLKNTTNANVTVTYVYTVYVNGCSNVEDVNVIVHPKPILSSSLTGTVCSGVPYHYVPTTTVIPITTYAWSRAAVTGLSPNTRSGTGNISDTITNTSSSNKTAAYAIVLTLTGTTCTNTETVNVTVKPAASPATITTMPSSSLCGGTLYQNFGAASAPAAGTSYEWSATNATVWATGINGQYAIVNFDHPGTTSVVSLNSNLTNGCNAAATYTVTVGAGTVALPAVIYTNGHFVCLDNDVTRFQWGYDDAVTLDSTLIASAIDQSYFLETPQFDTKHYWVMIKTSDSCLRKAYFNAPTGVTELNAGVANMKVYPNPATNNINVEVNTASAGTMTFEVVNMLGQKLNNVQGNDHKAVINVAGLPAGYYMIDCYIEGLKIGAAKFIKN